MQNSRVSKLRARRREYVNSIKSKSGCAKCGDKRHYVLVFHHDNGEKKDNVSSLIVKTASLEKINSEISKSIILCANCHRELHYLEKNQR